MILPDFEIFPQQMNQVSHYLDASTVYGSTVDDAQALRAFRGGLLRVEIKNNVHYLPAANSEPASLCNDKGCYAAGEK